MDPIELKEFLDLAAERYNNPSFIEHDPIQIPHRYRFKEDIEISAFLAASIAWGKRTMIIRSAEKMMNYMGDSPYDYVMNHLPADLEKLESFVHRTFNAEDLSYFIKALKHLYQHHGGLEAVFTANASSTSTQESIHLFRNLFFEIEHPARTEKHISDPRKNSAAKRLNMFLRWMVRADGRGVDFGLWKGISSSALSCPLDVHSGNVARKLGLITRTQNDAKTLLELDVSLRKFDPIDPAKYDFALFGLGVFEQFK